MDIGGQMTWASVVQAGASVIGFFYVGYQLWQARLNIRAATEHTLYNHYTDICKLFIAKPYLRPFFYDNVTMTELDKKKRHLREEIDMMSEAVLGLIEHSVLHEKNLPGDTWVNCWMPYMYERLYRSTELYNFFYPNRSWYTKALRCAVEEYTAKAKLFDTWWHKHADSPIKAAELGHGRRILRL